MKKLLLLCAASLGFVCSVQAVTVTNWLVNEWCTSAAEASNPNGVWTYEAGYNGDRVLPYLQLTNFVEEFGVDWMRDTWYNDNVDNAPQIGLDYWSGNPDDTCCELQVCTNGINTSIGWIAPSAGAVESIFAKWHSKSTDTATNCISAYVDHTRGTTILDTKYMFTNDYTHNYWALEPINITTPFQVLAGDVVYFNFVRRPGAAFHLVQIFGTRWDGGANNAYIAFTPVPEPGLCIALIAGIALMLRRK